MHNFNFGLNCVMTSPLHAATIRKRHYFFYFLRKLLWLLRKRVSFTENQYYLYVSPFKNYKSVCLCHLCNPAASIKASRGGTYIQLAPFSFSNKHIEPKEYTSVAL